MKLTAEQMFELLPAHMRLRDEEGGGALKAMFDLLSREAGIVQDDMFALLDSWFIETCPPWALPYIADLLDVRGRYDLGDRDGYSPRAWIANTIGFRRRKGTLAMLETLAHDSTGWSARAVEMMRLLSVSQHLNHIRAGAPGTADIADADALELEGGAFDSQPHTADIRSIALGQGRYNVPNIGIFVWRLQAYPMIEADAEPAGPGRFRFDPLGRDLPLVNLPETEEAAEHSAEDINVPAPLAYRPLYRELEARRAALALGRTPRARWFDGTPPFDVWLQAAPGDPFVKAAAEAVAVCDLHDVGAGDWRRPPAQLQYPDPAEAPVARQILVGVDPLRGRIAQPAGQNANAARVSYAYPAPGDLGGGPFDRRLSLAARLNRRVTWQAGVTRREQGVPGKIFATLAAAVADWNAQPPGTVGVIALLANETFAETLTGAKRIKMPEGSLLVLTSAGWPPSAKPDGGEERVAGRLAPQERRAVVRGQIQIDATAPLGSLAPGEIVIDGVLVDGQVRVLGTEPANLGRLTISHSTVGVGSGGVLVQGRHETLTLELDRAITGPVAIAQAGPNLVASESIVDAAGAAAVSAPETDALFDGVTLFGTTKVKSIEATDSIFTGLLTAARRQAKCVRFSYVPPASAAPRRYRCQPDLAVAAAAPGEDLDALRARLAPLFDSERYGDAGYARLARGCAAALREGGEAGGAMGAWRFLNEPRRLANLGGGLDEYLHLDLAAGAILQN
jgi:hypothetical protein